MRSRLDPNAQAEPTDHQGGGAVNYKDLHWHSVIHCLYQLYRSAFSIKHF